MAGPWRRGGAGRGARADARGRRRVHAGGRILLLQLQLCQRNKINNWDSLPDKYSGRCANNDSVGRGRHLLPRGAQAVNWRGPSQGVGCKHVCRYRPNVLRAPFSARRRYDVRRGGFFVFITRNRYRRLAISFRFFFFYNIATLIVEFSL